MIEFPVFEVGNLCFNLIKVSNYYIDTIKDVDFLQSMVDVLNLDSNADYYENSVYKIDISCLTSLLIYDEIRNLLVDYGKIDDAVNFVRTFGKDVMYVAKAFLEKCSGVDFIDAYTRGLTEHTVSRVLKDVEGKTLTPDLINKIVSYSNILLYETYDSAFSGDVITEFLTILDILYLSATGSSLHSNLGLHDVYEEMDKRYNSLIGKDDE